MRVVALDMHRASTVAAVTRLLQLCFTPQSVPRIHASKRWWGALDGARHLVGVASLDGHELWDVCVHPRCRNCGIASHMVLQLCRSAPLMRLFLADRKLLPFYARLGFVPDPAAELPPRAVLSMVRRNNPKEVPALATNGRVERAKSG